MYSTQIAAAKVRKAAIAQYEHPRSSLTLEKQEARYRIIKTRLPKEEEEERRSKMRITM